MYESYQLLISGWLYWHNFEFNVGHGYVNATELYAAYVYESF